MISLLFTRGYLIHTNTIKKRFRSSIRRGTGEAYFIIRDNPNIDFSNDIINASLKNYAYDGQSESSRAVYLSEIIELSNQKLDIERYIMKGLHTEKEDTWALVQLFHLAQIFAEKGNNEARQAMYNRFYEDCIEYSDWVGSCQIIALDGLKGLIFIADKIGRSLSGDPDDYIDDSDIEECQELNPTINVYEELEKESSKNKYVKLYLDTIKKTKEHSAKNKREPIVYKDIIDEVEKSSFFGFIRRKKLTKEEVELVATRLKQETDTKKIEQYLRFFQYFKYPFDNDLILHYAQKRPTSKNRITEFAIGALSLLKSEQIRDFALNKLSRTSRPERYLGILINNYQKGDHELLISIAESTHSEHRIENLAIEVIDIYKANKTADCKQPIEILYNKLTCGIHRNSLIETLLENSVLSDKIREEALHDSYLDTRELIKNYKK